MTYVINPYRFSGGITDPTDIAGLVLWLDASDATTLYTDTGKTTPVSSDGDNVARWADKSSNGWDCYEIGAGLGPTYKTGAVNSLDACLFNGSSEYLITAVAINAPLNNASDGSWTVFAVVKTGGTLTGTKYIVDADPGSGTRIAQYIRTNATDAEAVGFTGAAAKLDAAGATLSTSTAYLLHSVHDGSSSVEMFVNGTGNGSTASGGANNYSATQDYTVGRFFGSASGYWNGHVCEVVAYNLDISAGDISNVVTYLKNKWGIS